MRAIRLLAATIAAVAVLFVTSGAALPAVADEPSGSFDFWSQEVVEGEPWSGPAFPVECAQGTSRINCTPTNLAESKEEKCFRNVVYADSRVVVCTTYPSNTKQLEAAGGKALELMYGCQFGDATCTIAETFGRAMASMVMGNIAWVLDNVSFNTSTALWTSASGEWAWWMGAIILIMLGASMIAIAQAALTRDRHEIIGAFKRVGLAWPLAVFAYWAVGNLLDFFDLLTVGFVDREGSGQGLYPTIQNLIFGGGGGNFWAAGIVITFLNAAIFVLVFVLSFRNLALAALIALAPIAFMMFPMKLGVNWVISWCSAVVALLLTGPLTLGFMMLIVNGMGDVDSLWSIRAIPLTIGLLMVSFTPFAVMGLLSFAGTQAAGAADAVGSRAGQSAKNAGSEASRSLTSTIKDRVGAARARQGRSSSPSAPNSQPRPGTRPGTGPSPRPGTGPGTGPGTWSNPAPTSRTNSAQSNPTPAPQSAPTPKPTR